MGFRIFWLFLLIGLVLIFCLFAPFIIGRYCGHGWGFSAGMASVLAWLSLARKIALPPITRLIILAYLVFIVIFELMHLLQ